MDMFKEYSITKEEYLNGSFIDVSKEDIDNAMTADGVTLEDFAF